MATYYSLIDGIITDPNVFGITISSLDTKNLTSTIPISSIEYRLPPLSSDGNPIAGLSLNLSSVNAINSNDTLTVKALCGENILTTKTFYLSNFTQYIDYKNQPSNLSINYQLLQFDTPLTIALSSFYIFTIQASNQNKLSLIGERPRLKEWIGNVDYDTMDKPTANNYRPLTSDNPLNIDNNFSFDLKYGTTLSQITLPNYGSLSGSYTVDFWYKRFSTPTTTGYIYQASGASFCVVIDNSNVLSFRTLTGVATSVTTFNGPIINANVWYHIAISKKLNQTTIYVDGLSVINVSNVNNGLTFNNNVLGSSPHGMFNNFRIVSGINLYEGASFTKPNKISAIIPNTVAYVNAHTHNFNKSYIKTFSQSISSDKSSILNIFHNISTNISTNLTADSIFIQNGGTLSYSTLTANPYINSIILTGVSGLQISNKGVFNMGFLNDPIKIIKVGANWTRFKPKLLLSNGSINIYNGGVFNAYGQYVPKSGTVSGGIKALTNNGNTSVDFVDDIIDKWAINDELYYSTPEKTTTNVSINIGNIVTPPYNTNTCILCSNFPKGSNSIIGSTIIPQIPSVWNFSRNGVIAGFNSTNRTYFIINGGATFNVNNIELTNLGLVTPQTNPFLLRNDFNTIINISGCSFGNRDPITTNLNLFTYQTSAIKNLNIVDNNILGNLNLQFSTLTSAYLDGVNVTNNSLLYSQYDGMSLSCLSGNNVNIKDNYIVSPKTVGIRVNDIKLKNSNLGGISYNSGTQGSIIAGISGINCDTIKIGSIYSNAEGIIYNIVNSNNDFILTDSYAISSTGFGLAVNNSNLIYLTPFNLKINGLLSRNNTNAGIIVANCYGSLNNLNLQNNTNYNAILNIGNNYTVIDRITSINTTSGVLLSGCKNYNETFIRNGILSGGIPLILSGCRFEEFSLQNSVLCGGGLVSFQALTSSELPRIEGSYSFNSCYFKTGTEISSNIVSSYQYDINKELGYSVSNMNGLSTNNFKWVFAGSVSTDFSKKLPTSKASEKLTPISNLIKLRSSVKSIPINANDLVVVGVSIYKSAAADGQNYTGTDPKIILKNNPLIGYNYTVLDTITGSNGQWIRKQFTLPVVNANGFAEIYIECSGSINSGWINIDGWSVNYGAGKYWYSTNPSLSDWSNLDNWYLDTARKFKAATLPSKASEVIVTGNNVPYINLDREDWINPRSISNTATTTAALTVYSNKGAFLTSRISGNITFKGTASYSNQP